MAGSNSIPTKIRRTSEPAMEWSKSMTTETGEEIAKVTRAGGEGVDWRDHGDGAGVTLVEG
jgi:hypothetical protein